MAKPSWVNRNERNRATVKKYAALRAELKAKKDYAGLAQLPRDASPMRVVNRCQVTGRRRAFIRRFKISRLTFRELASSGLIPGVTKSSWKGLELAVRLPGCLHAMRISFLSFGLRLALSTSLTD